jgi:O-methyltransferase
MFNFFGYTIIKKNSFMNRMEDLIVEATPEELEIINKTIKISLASKLNLFSIIQSLKYIRNNNIKGDLV